MNIPSFAEVIPTLQGRDRLNEQAIREEIHRLQNDFGKDFAAARSDGMDEIEARQLAMLLGITAVVSYNETYQKELGQLMAKLFQLRKARKSRGSSETTRHTHDGTEQESFPTNK